MRGSFQSGLLHAQGRPSDAKGTAESAEHSTPDLDESKLAPPVASGRHVVSMYGKPSQALQTPHSHP